jgi:hypothetical protein
MNPDEADNPHGMPTCDTMPDLFPGRCVVLVPFQGRIVSQCQSALLELERRGYETMIEHSISRSATNTRID